ncbi:efflux RND transporter periplasmic adaptor subunit [Methylococcus sp. EFPC2]|uniref:efflux RND transporter periplasmic adaptor subunit n=1 Tax=Methylococcus sp. EFPC2 TaxID=2812648 RepID=UPI0019675269|nr:efflux RND transporter periplasmic adaptor subunit [Methylococcus sp. EFPC2]QSA97864.1 efflux RND transporter periplasmic adaptor subunit [Methylococcus sp. EFPC2]
MTMMWSGKRNGAAVACLWMAGAWPAFALDAKGLDCVIEPKMTVELSSPVPGVLDEILVERGARVSKNQVLAKLKSGVEEANVKLARAQAELNSEINASQARLNLNARVHGRTSELFKTQMVPLSEADEAETKKIVAEYELKKAREDKQIAHLELERASELLKQRSLASTIDGVVVKRYKAPGEYVEDQPVLKIAQDDPLNVEVIAPLSLYGTIREGMMGEVRPEEPVGGKHVARVSIVDTVIDAASGTFGIRLELPNPQHQVPAGVRCDIRFLTGESTPSR